jgi:protein-L-isoaspartate(D-aspartate) O-methyltransferase
LLNELQQQGVTDQRVLAAMRAVPRAEFVPEESRQRAYENIPLSIGMGQTISQPLVVGLMTQALHVGPDHRVLEVGTGSGYQTAILGELAGTVISVERHQRLADSARRRLERMGYRNAYIYPGSGSAGWADQAPYDRIVVTAGSPRIPIHLVAQLTRHGRIVVPVGTQHEQRLMAIEKGDHGLAEIDLGPVRFVPLIGEGAWDEKTLD